MIITIKIISIIGVLCMLLYTGWMIKKNGKMLSSLSSTAYIVSKPWQFTFVMCLCAFLITPYMITLLPGILGYIGMLFLIGLIMVGCSPHYKKVNKIMHYSGGYLAGVMTLIAVAYLYWPLLFAWIPFLIHCVLVKSENHTFYSECICFITLGICLIIF